MAWLYYIIPSVVAVAALGAIVWIYARNLPKASALDLEAMPEYRQHTRKTSLVEERLRRKAASWRLSLRAFFKPIGAVITKLLRSMFRGLVEKEREYRQAAKGLVPDAETTVAPTSVATTIQEGRALLDDGKFAEAEKKFIAAIGNDARAIDAYRGLASVYEDMNNVNDAIATLQFLVQLDPKDESTYRRLADLYKGEKKYEEAMDASEQALELGPNNPKNLDTFIQLAILNELKYKAQSSLDKLSKVNPENQKLAKYQEEINQLWSWCEPQASVAIALRGRPYSDCYVRCTPHNLLPLPACAGR